MILLRYTICRDYEWIFVSKFNLYDNLVEIVNKIFLNFLMRPNGTLNSQRQNVSSLDTVVQKWSNIEDITYIIFKTINLLNLFSKPIKETSKKRFYKMGRVVQNSNPKNWKSKFLHIATPLFEAKPIFREIVFTSEIMRSGITSISWYKKVFNLYIY